ncbi:unnamed protein product [Chrysoparadoxa australica]
MRYFETARRLHPLGSLVYIHLAVACHTFYGNLNCDLRAARTKEAYSRVERLFEKAQMLDTSRSHHHEIVATHRAYTSLFKHRGTNLEQRTIKFMACPLAWEDEGEQSPFQTSAVVSGKQYGCFLKLEAAPSPAAGGSCDSLYPGWAVLISQEEVNIIASAAIEEAVRDGRPRDMMQSMDKYRLVSSYAVPKVVMVGKWRGGERLYAPCLPPLKRARDGLIGALTDHRAAACLQRAFRGFQGMAQFKRLNFQLNSITKQQEKLQMRLQEKAERRKREGHAAMVIQGVVKGWMFRKHLREMHLAVSVCQGAFRRYQLAKKQREFERWKLEGPQVTVVHRAGHMISHRSLLLTVMMCGLSFKLVGADPSSCMRYCGYCYEYEVMSLLLEHNRRFPNERYHIKTWHHHRIVNLMISQLYLIDSVRAPTSELLAMAQDKVLVIMPREVHGKGILKDAERGRLLADVVKGRRRKSSNTGHKRVAVAMG